jgi:large subunit ribosomal protein L15
MTIGLHTIKPAKGSRKKVRRLGRGHGSGRGTTAGRGTKGQRARTGGRGGLKYFGMKQIVLSLPKKRGFKGLNEKPQILNIADLDAKFADGAEIKPAILKKTGLIESATNVKILGKGETKKKFSVSGCQFSKSAKEKIEKAGGTTK